MESGFLKKYYSRGLHFSFLMQKEVSNKGAFLKIPKFMRGKKQLSVK